MKSVCAGVHIKRETDAAAEAQWIAPADGQPSVGDIVLFYGKGGTDGPAWVPAEFCLSLGAAAALSECQVRAGQPSVMVQRLDTRQYEWGPATNVRRWLRRETWRELRGRFILSFHGWKPVGALAEAPHEGAEAGGGTDVITVATGTKLVEIWTRSGHLDHLIKKLRARYGHVKPNKDAVARARQIRAARYMEAWLGPDLETPKTTAAAPSGTGAQRTGASDVGPAIKQEPQDFIGYVGDFDLDRKPMDTE